VVSASTVNDRGRPPTETQCDLQRLEAALKQLEAEYNMFFDGQLPKPPWQTRSRVEAIVKQYDRAHIRNTGERFRFTTLQARYAAFIDLWDRGLRAREEDRAGPFARKRTDKPPEPQRPSDRIVHVVSFSDPMKEMDELHDLYNSLVETRREIGESAVPFHKFETGRHGRGRVSRVGQGRRGELHRPRHEGQHGLGSTRSCQLTAISSFQLEATYVVSGFRLR
jgi:hypothetical protein